MVLTSSMISSPAYHVQIRPLLLACIVALSLTSSPQICSAAAEAAAEPWQGVSFAADPVALLEAAATVPAADGVDVLVLLEERHLRFDAQGRRVLRNRLVYRILSPAGLQGWSSTAARWSPWHQKRPSLRARVISPRGTEHWLDAATIGEFTLSEEQPEVLSDRRELRALLPAISVEAVVETEAVITDLAPYFDGGDVDFFFFGQEVPVRQTRLTVEAPDSLPLSYLVWHLPSVEPRRMTEAERVQLVFESGPLDALSMPETLLPADEPGRPLVGISTAESWSEVARHYSEIVDAQTAGMALGHIVGEALRGAETRPERIPDW